MLWALVGLMRQARKYANKEFIAANHVAHRRRVITSKWRKGKEEYLYSAFIQRFVSKRSDMNHTVLPANYTMPAFSS